MTWPVRLAATCERWCGLRLALATSEPGLLRVVTERAAALALGDPEAYVQQLERGDEAELAVLVDAITTGQTDFFRDARQLQAVARLLVQMHGGRTLDVWSAGCATGEEAYTLAMLAADAGVSCRILATDINSRFLDRARSGVYPVERIEALPPARKLAFERVPHGVRVPAGVARMIEFRRHNLADARLPTSPSGAWDLIVCRNVFIYFHRARVDAVVERLAASLRPEGWLALGAADPWCGHTRGLEVVDVDGQLFYRRSPPRPTPPAPSPPSPPPPLARPTSAPPLDVVARLSRGNALLAKHDFAAALREYESVAVEAPLMAEVHCLLGLLHRKHGDLGAAKASLRRALFLDADFWPAAYLLASCLERDGAHVQARAEFRHTLTLLDRWPGPPPFRSTLAGLRGLELDPHEVATACRRRIPG
jgi:chemotaxis protein methyltransferase CheR